MTQTPLSERISEAFWKNWLALAATLGLTAVTITFYRHQAYGSALFIGVMAGLQLGTFISGVAHDMLLAEYKRIIDLQLGVIREFVDIGKQVQRELDKANKQIRKA